MNRYVFALLLVLVVAVTVIVSMLIGAGQIQEAREVATAAGSGLFVVTVLWFIFESRH